MESPCQNSSEENKKLYYDNLDSDKKYQVNYISYQVSIPTKNY